MLLRYPRGTTVWSAGHPGFWFDRFVNNVVPPKKTSGTAAFASLDAKTFAQDNGGPSKGGFLNNRLFS